MTRRVGKRHDGGVALVAFVLVIAFVGMLVGLGRLKTHEYAVKRRLERTYQIEKLLATRDALASANAGLSASKGNVLTNSFECLNFSDGLQVVIEPVLPVDSQEMDALGKACGWGDFRNRSEASITVDQDKGIFRFQAPMGTNGIAYRAAVFRKAVRPWFDNEFGYMYILELDEANDEFNLGKLRLYLIGLAAEGIPHWSADDVGGLEDMERDFDDILGKCPWIRMELSMVGSSKTARRDIAIHDTNGGDALVFLRTNVVHSSKNDQYSHGGGFLLSSTAFCGFGETSWHEKLFSARWDLTRNCKFGFDAHAFTNAFQSSVIAIEHVFPTNVPSNFAELEEKAEKDGGELRRSITVDSFVMREPTTYRVRVFNPEVTSDKGRDVVTWIFQTREPNPSAKISGQQCILDTFGREPSDLRLERRGDFPE